MERKGFEVGQVFKLCKQDTNTNKEEEKRNNGISKLVFMSHDLTMHVGILAHQFKTKIIFKAEFSGCHDACIWCTHCKNNLEGRKIRCCLDFQFLSPITLFSSPITGDDNFAPPCPAKMVGRGWGNILSPHHGAGWGWVSYFYPQPTPPRPAPPCPNKNYNCKFSNKKVVSPYWEKAKLILKELINFYLL